MPRTSSATLTRGRTKLIFVALLLALACALTVGTRAWIMTIKNPAPAAPMPQHERSHIQINSLHLTLRTTGFEPAEITGRAGHFLLAVDNMTGTNEVTLRLTREPSVELREVSLPLNKSRWREVVNLPPGVYTLAEVNHPDWACRVTLTEP